MKILVSLLLLMMSLPLVQGQQRFYELPIDLDSSVLLILKYPEVDTDWKREGLEDERYFRRQQRRWNRQVNSLNDSLYQALLTYPYPYLLADSVSFDSAREEGAHYMLESTFTFGLQYETFAAGEAILDGELVPNYTGPIGRQTQYDPSGKGEVTAPSGYTENRLYYWRIRDLDTGDEYYFKSNFSDQVQEGAGFYGSLPFVLPKLIETLMP